MSYCHDRAPLPDWMREIATEEFSKASVTSVATLSARQYLTPALYAANGINFQKHEFLTNA
jgi:hypothetical protein